MKLALFIFLITTTAEASYIRFWIGLKKPTVDTVKFVGGLNKTFFKKTVDLGKGKGLTAYLPYVTRMNDSDLPDEVALVIYESEEKYKTLRATDEGKSYIDLHWDFFDSNQSKSTVVEPFDGKLEVGSAYELKPEFKDYQSAKTVVSIYQYQKSVMDEVKQNFESLKKQVNVLNSILIVRSRYIIEYRVMNQPVLQKLISKDEALLEQKELSQLKITGEPPFVSYGEGVNFQF